MLNPEGTIPNVVSVRQMVSGRLLAMISEIRWPRFEEEAAHLRFQRRHFMAKKYRTI
jgi:hypothetical protein